MPPDIFPTPAPVKPDWKSKTWWLNLGMFLLNALFAYLGSDTVVPMIAEPVTVVGAALPGVALATSAATAAVVGSFFSPFSMLAIANLVLRYFTTRGVSFFMSEK